MKCGLRVRTRGGLAREKGHQSCGLFFNCLRLPARSPLCLSCPGAGKNGAGENGADGA